MTTLNKSRQQQKKALYCEICEKEFKSNNGLENHFNIVYKLMEANKWNATQGATDKLFFISADTDTGR